MRRIRIFGLLALLIVLSTGGRAVSAQVEGAEGLDTPTLYQRACAACHGSEGQGLPPDSPVYQNFERPPASFTDPLFNSREPAADWLLVVLHGGARIGLSSQMPAYGEVLSEEQAADLVDYLKSLADTRKYPPGDLNFLRPIDTIKAFPEDELLFLSRYESREEEPRAWRNTLYYGRRFGARYQAEVTLSHQDQGEVSEIDALELGFKAPVYWSLEKSTLLTLGLDVVIPLGEEEASEEVIPYFSFAKGLGAAWTLQGTLRSHLPVDDTGDGDVKLSTILHWLPSIWPRSVAPALEATVTAPFEGDKDVEATVIPQLYGGLSKLGHVALAAGVEIPLNDLAYDYRIRVFFLWDIADGPFWTGW